MRYGYGYQNNQKIMMIGVILVLIALALVISYFAIPSILESKIVKVLIYNTGFWIVLFVAAIFGLYRKLTNPEDFTWGELPIQLGASTIVIIILYTLFFTTAGNLSDWEVLNGYVQKAEYYEEWTEEVTYTEEERCGTDKDGNAIYRTVTKKRHDYHPPSWQLVTTIGDISVDKSTYRHYVSHWGNERKKSLFHLNQVSIGDGDMFFCQHAGAQDDRLVPASQSHYYVNYLKASDSIRKISGQISSFKNLLRPYPEITSGQFGPIEINRVINAGVSLPANWQQELDRELDRALVNLGSAKQVNILVYLAKTSDPQFGHALEEFWVKGKKNDVVVVLGVDQFPQINFVHIMAWTKVEEFPITLRNELMDLDLSDPYRIARTITSRISAPGSSGGFVRMPMSDLEYLIRDIRLPLWCQIIIVLIGGGVSFGVSVWLVREKVA